MSNQIEEVEYDSIDYLKVNTIFENMSANLPKVELDYILYLTLEKLNMKVLQMISYEDTWEHFFNDDDLKKYTPKITEEYYNNLIKCRFFRHCETFENCIDTILVDLDENQD
jgi:hypothetical protein